MGALWPTAHPPGGQVPWRGAPRAPVAPRSRRRLAQGFHAPASGCKQGSHPPCARSRTLPLLPQVEEGEHERSVPHCFTICAAQKTVVVAARYELSSSASAGPQGFPVMIWGSPRVESVSRRVCAPSSPTCYGTRGAASPWVGSL